MQTAVINVRTDKEIKKNALEAARELGISLSDIINAALRNFIRTREVIISDAPQMTPEFEKYLGRIEEDIKHNRNIVGPFKSGEEMDKYLSSK
jgi:addiction module RelB/DinJ family antitoxin